MNTMHSGDLVWVRPTTGLWCELDGYPVFTLPITDNLVFIEDNTPLLFLETRTVEYYWVKDYVMAAGKDWFAKASWHNDVVYLVTDGRPYNIDMFYFKTIFFVWNRNEGKK